MSQGSEGIGEQTFAYYLAAKRNRKRWLTDLRLAAAIGAGEHVHLLDQDGDWCLDGACEIPPRTGVRGMEPAEVIVDEIADWQPPQWKETA